MILSPESPSAKAVGRVAILSAALQASQRLARTVPQRRLFDGMGIKEMSNRGGSRPKRRRDDGRGGARVGAGALVRRLQLDKDTAQMLRILTLTRRGVSSNPDLQPVNVVTDLIRAAYAEFEDGIEEYGAEL